METVFYMCPHSADVGRGRLAEFERAALGCTAGSRPHFEFVTSFPQPKVSNDLQQFDIWVIDTRGQTGAWATSEARTLLASLATDAGTDGRPLHKTWVVVDRNALGLQISFEAGRLGIAEVLAVENTPSGWAGIWKRVSDGVIRGRQGRVGLCLAGGGVEGLYYELGVLRALQDFMPTFDLQQVDILCGIGAGAVIAAFLANNIPVQEISDGLREGRGRLDPLNWSSIFDPNYGELLNRLGESMTAVAALRATPLQGFFRLAPNGMFAGRALRDYLERQLTKPGLTNRFSELPRELYIGATDQDTAEHVVFGSTHWQDVPISHAVRASTALTPFFAPERIHGRYYVDGAFSRTTNVKIAVERGATTVLLIDPFVPFHSRTAGEIYQRGGMAVGMQGLKSLIHGRFERALKIMRTMYPFVGFHLFQPDEATLRTIAGIGGNWFQHPEVEEIAYRETIRRLRQREGEGLQQALSQHGIRFSTPSSLHGILQDDD